MQEGKVNYHVSRLAGYMVDRVSDYIGAPSMPKHSHDELRYTTDVTCHVKRSALWPLCPVASWKTAAARQSACMTDSLRT